jgi:hypothetical protein
MSWAGMVWFDGDWDGIGIGIGYVKGVGYPSPFFHTFIWRQPFMHEYNIHLCALQSSLCFSYCTHVQ